MQCVRLLCSSDTQLKSAFKNYEQLKRAHQDIELKEDFQEEVKHVFEFCITNVKDIPQKQLDAAYYLLSNWTPSLEQKIVDHIQELYKQKQIVEREVPVYPSQTELLGTHGYIFLCFLLHIIGIVERAEASLPKATCGWTVHNSRLWG